MKKQTILHKTSLLFFILLLATISLFVLGCNVSENATVSNPNQVCMEGPFNGNQFTYCSSNMQHDNAIHVLQLYSNQIFTLEANKGFALKGYVSRHDNENNYYLRTLGSLLPRDEQQNPIYDFDFISDNVLTLEIVDPKILRVEKKAIGAPRLMTPNGYWLGQINFPCKIVLHTADQKPKFLLEKKAIYDMEVLADQYLVVLSADHISDEIWTNVITVYSVPDLLKNNTEPLFEKVYKNDTGSTGIYHHYLISNKESLFSVLTSKEVLETFTIQNNEIVPVHDRELLSNQDDSSTKLRTFHAAYIPSTDKVLVWKRRFTSEESSFIQIYNTQQNEVIQSIDPPNEGYVLTYAIPFYNEFEKGFFLFFVHEDTDDTISTYVVIPD